MEAERNTSEAWTELQKLQAQALHQGTKIEHSVIVHKPVGEVFSFWRDERNLPKFMSHLQEIRRESALRTHWVWRVDGGQLIEWDQEIIAELHNRMISWQTIGEPIIMQAGSVWFKQTPQKGFTEVHMQLIYRLNETHTDKKIEKLLGESPEQILRKDLERFREVLEAAPRARAQSRGG